MNDNVVEEDDELSEEKARPGDSAFMRFMLPVGRSGWAVAAGYLGLLSILMVPAPFALLTGVLGVLEIRRNPRKHGLVRAGFGILLGAVFTVLLVVFLIAGPPGEA